MSVRFIIETNDDRIANEFGGQMRAYLMHAKGYDITKDNANEIEAMRIIHDQVPDVVNMRKEYFGNDD